MWTAQYTRAQMRRAALVTVGLGLFAAGLLAACGGDSVGDVAGSSTGDRSVSIVLSGTLTLSGEVDADDKVLINAMAITRCLERRFGLVVDTHAHERSRWYGGEMRAEFSVVTSDPRSASPALTSGAELGFALNEQEAQKDRGRAPQGVCGSARNRLSSRGKRRSRLGSTGAEKAARTSRGLLVEPRR